MFLVLYVVFAIILYYKTLDKCNANYNEKASFVVLGVFVGLFLLQIATYYGRFLFGLLALAAIIITFFCVKSIFAAANTEKWYVHVAKWLTALVAIGAAMFTLSHDTVGSPTQIGLFIGILTMTGAVVFILNFRSEITHNIVVYRPVTAVVCVIACCLFFFVAIKGSANASESVAGLEDANDVTVKFIEESAWESFFEGGEQ